MRVALPVVAYRAAQNRGNHGAHFFAFNGFLHRIGNLLGFAFVSLRTGEHHHEEGEQQGDEVGIGYQPAFMIFVLRDAFLTGHSYVLRLGFRGSRRAHARF